MDIILITTFVFLLVVTIIRWCRNEHLDDYDTSLQREINDGFDKFFAEQKKGQRLRRNRVKGRIKDAFRRNNQLLCKRGC